MNRSYAKNSLCRYRIKHPVYLFLSSHLSCCVPNTMQAMGIHLSGSPFQAWCSISLNNNNSTKEECCFLEMSLLIIESVGMRESYHSLFLSTSFIYSTKFIVYLERFSLFVRSKFCSLASLDCFPKYRNVQWIFYEYHCVSGMFETMRCDSEKPHSITENHSLIMPFGWEKRSFNVYQIYCCGSVHYLSSDINQNKSTEWK